MNGGRKITAMVLGLWAAAATFSVQAQQNYLGASAVLQKVSGQTNTSDKSETPRVKELAQLKRDVKAFGTRVATLSGADAAKEWLELFDRTSKLTRASVRNFNEMEEPVDFNSLMEVLPPSGAWDALEKAVEARPPVKGLAAGTREIALRLLAHTLTGNQAAQKADLASLEALFAKADQNESYNLANAFDQLNEAMMQLAADPSVIMTSLERQLARAQNKDEGQSLNVPNLISLVGTNKAEEFLRKALRTSYGQIQITQGSEMKTLARKLALEQVTELKAPQWQLAESLDAAELYEAMDKRFVKPDEDQAGSGTNAPVLPIRRGFVRGDYDRSTAEWYYLLGLITHHRTKEAVELSKKIGKDQQGYLPPDALTSLERAGYGAALNDFFHELLSQNPGLNFWDQYVRVAAGAGKADEMLALAQASVAKEDISERARKNIRAHLYKALLAADKVEEGAKELERMLATDKADADDASQPGSEDFYGGEGKADIGMTLARIGHLVDRKQWVEEGTAAARKALTPSTSKQANHNYDTVENTTALAGLLAETGHGPQAEEVLADAIAATTRKAEDEQNGVSFYGEKQGRAYLIALAQLYHQAGRQSDVIVLLDEAPQWEAKDLAEIYQENGSMMMFHPHHASGDGVVGYLAASALAQTGHKDEARKIIDALLEHDGGFDPAYELLMELGDTNMPDYLDKLFARDQFEERPLIWKAHWLRQAGKLEEAEASARQAISVDPSDGEQGPGNRMRAYAELADIREARGDKKQAEFFRGAVTAIRMSEQADRFYEAGLLTRAVKMYEDSLNHFADAYCIQSRLALRLSELGMHEQAEAHYRRAYELMPESFGRVESHCFGCEGVFNGEQAQNLAEKVFAELAVKTPNKPQVHYLLGYLRQEQGRYQEALPELQRAVKLDPDYLNAWKHLSEIQAELHLPAADRDAVVLNLIRLDPLARHDHPNFANVSDLRALWHAVEAAEKFEPATPTALYPLAASKAALEAKSKRPKNAQQRRMVRYVDGVEQGRKLTPASAISQQRIMGVIIGMLGGSAMNYYFQ